MPTTERSSDVTADRTSRSANGSSVEQSVGGYWWQSYSWPKRRHAVRAQELHHLLVILQRALGSEWMTMENVLSLLNAVDPEQMVRDLLAGTGSQTYPSRTCARCGNSFLPTGPNHKSCHACKPRAYREMNAKRQRRFRKKITRLGVTILGLGPHNVARKAGRKTALEGVGSSTPRPTLRSPVLNAVLGAFRQRHLFDYTLRNLPGGLRPELRFRFQLLVPGP